jgi:hypothetical protein
VGTLLVMTKKSYKKKSEVAHHGSKATSEDVTTTFEGLLTGLTTLGSFQTVQEFFELSDIEVVFGSGLAGRNRGGHVTYV